MQPLIAQGAVTLIALLPGPAAAPVGAGDPHTGVGCILHVHAPRQVMFQVDGSVVQDDLEERKCKEIQEFRKPFTVF